MEIIVAPIYLVIMISNITGGVYKIEPGSSCGWRLLLLRAKMARWAVSLMQPERKRALHHFRATVMTSKGRDRR